MVKDIVCWVIGGFFFLIALMTTSRIGADSTMLDPIEIRELGYVILYGLVGLAFVISGSIFHTRTND